MSEIVSKKFIAGKWEMAIGNILIPADLLGDINLKYSEKLFEMSTQAGVRKIPSGIPETAEMSFRLFVPNIDYLGKIWPELHESSTAAGGSLTFGKSVASQTPKPINLHQSGEKTDDSDFHIFAGTAAVEINAELSTSDLFALEVMIHAHPTERGYIRLGTGDKTKKSVYDVATQATKPVVG